MLLRHISDDETGGKHFAGFEVIGIRTNIADMGIRQRNELTIV